MEITQTRLIELFVYNELTGEFLHRTTKRGGKNAGDTAGCLNRNGYRVIRIDKKLMYAHRLAWLYVHGHLPPEEIDHINGLQYDNKIANLRPVCRVVNQQNIRKPLSNNKSGFIGVVYSKQHRKYKAGITIDGSNVHLGLFQDAETAHQTYLKVKRLAHEGCTI